MKKPTKTRQLDKTTPRTLTANDLRAVVGGTVMNNPLYTAAAVMNNPLYAAEAEVMNNPLYQGSGTEGANPLYV
ncbi:MAG TPA: hypothetical protein VNO30_35220 [Kofleriaceae bacterium]|nr:hypothetical protein [Kofleriaceae bacterium]